MPKLDPSNYTLSGEEKVFNLCQNTKDLILDRCQCNVSIDQKEKTVKISVDPSLAQLYEEGLTTLERLYSQEMDFDEDEEDDEDFSSEKLQKLQKRFDILSPSKCIFYYLYYFAITFKDLSEWEYDDYGNN